MMSLTKAKAVAKDPHAYTTEELDDALTVIVEDDRLSEAQVTRLQAAIDPVIRERIAFAKRTEDAPEELKRIFAHWHYDPVLMRRAIDYLKSDEAGA